VPSLLFRRRDEPTSTGRSVVLEFASHRVNGGGRMRAWRCRIECTLVGPLRCACGGPLGRASRGPPDVFLGACLCTRTHAHHPEQARELMEGAGGTPGGIFGGL